MKVRRILFLVVVFAVCAVCTISYAGKEKFETLEAYNKAQGLFENEKYDEAIKAYDDFIKKYPSNSLAVAAKYYSAECYRKEDKDSKAISGYEGLIEEYNDGFWVDNAVKRLKQLKAK